MARDGEASIIPNPKSSNQSTTPPVSSYRSANYGIDNDPIKIMKDLSIKSLAENC